MRMKGCMIETELQFIGVGGEHGESVTVFGRCGGIPIRLGGDSHQRIAIEQFLRCIDRRAVVLS